MRTPAVLLAVLTLSACAALEPLPTGLAIEGHQLDRTVARVEAPFTYRSTFYSAKFPAGDYVPAFVDAAGVYFKPPTAVVGQTIGGGREFDGGLYISRRSWSDVKVFIIDGTPHRFDAAEPIKVRPAQR